MFLVWDKPLHEHLEHLNRGSLSALNWMRQLFNKHKTYLKKIANASNKINRNCINLLIDDNFHDKGMQQVDQKPALFIHFTHSEEHLK